MNEIIISVNEIIISVKEIIISVKEIMVVNKCFFFTQTMPFFNVLIKISRDKKMLEIKSKKASLGENDGYTPPPPYGNTKQNTVFAFKLNSDLKAAYLQLSPERENQ